MGALKYMGMTPEECGQDATNYAWAFEQRPMVLDKAS
jgi:hypothetical protein